MNSIDSKKIGEEMYKMIADLYPICRSITGNGVRETLKIVNSLIPLKIQEVPSGTRVFDWTVPKEWNIRDAYVKNSAGERIIDFKKSNLHVLNYSIPVNKMVTFLELKEHIFTLPEYPDWIPYRTSYYNENWGFCVAYNQVKEFKDNEYEVLIDSSIEEGSLTFGEYLIKGRKEDEVIISCHICHPSLCNDNLSGIALVTFLSQHLSSHPLRYSYRFLFIPGTIGSITWLSLNEERVAYIKHGLVVALVGDRGSITYKKSRKGNAEIDRVAEYVLRHSGNEYKIIDFTPYGYDERQFCSPGFDLPVGCFMRSQHGQYPEYHTSADNLDFIDPESLADSFEKCLAILNIIENNRRFINMNSKCEPQLGKKGIYGSIGGEKDRKIKELAMLWVLNLSDGNNTLLDISDRSGLGFTVIKEVADTLVRNDLLKECQE